MPFNIEYLDGKKEVVDADHYGEKEGWFEFTRWEGKKPRQALRVRTDDVHRIDHVKSN